MCVCVSLLSQFVLRSGPHCWAANFPANAANFSLFTRKVYDGKSAALKQFKKKEDDCGKVGDCKQTKQKNLKPNSMEKKDLIWQSGECTSIFYEQMIGYCVRFFDTSIIEPIFKWKNNCFRQLESDDESTVKFIKRPEKLPAGMLNICLTLSSKFSILCHESCINICHFPSCFWYRKWYTLVQAETDFVSVTFVTVSWLGTNSIGTMSIQVCVFCLVKSLSVKVAKNVLKNG